MKSPILSFADCNMVATGGAFGWRQRLPGFTIRQHAETGRFYVKRDRDGATISAGHASPDDAERCNADLKPRPLA